MTKFTENMDKFFDVVPQTETTLPSTEVLNSKPLVHEEDVIEDFENARNTHHELMAKGQEMVEDMLAIARESEKARDFEVAANLLKSLLDANKTILDLHNQTKQIIGTPETKKENNSKTINNTVFVGSTAELSKFMTDFKKNKEITVN